MPAVFVIDPANSKKQTFTGIIDTSGVQVTSVVWTAGSNVAHDAGATVVDYETATHWAMISKGILVQHAQDGTHTAITATSLSNSGTTTLTGPVTIKSYDGYITSPDTWTYASASSFTISGVDRTAQFPSGTKIKLTQTTAKYFYVTSSSFSTNTTVNITAGSTYTLANAAITSPLYSYDSTPQSFPNSFAWTGTVVGWSGSPSPATQYFSMNGKLVYWQIDYSGTSNATTVSFTLPIPPSTHTVNVEGKVALSVDNGSITAGSSWVIVTTAGTPTISAFVDNGRSNLWTNSGTKQFRAQGFYEAA